MTTRESILNSVFNGEDKPEFSIGETVVIEYEVFISSDLPKWPRQDRGIVTGVKAEMSTDASRRKIHWSYEVINFCSQNFVANWYGGLSGRSGYKIVKVEPDD
jgi:hypothetical protein